MKRVVCQTYITMCAGRYRILKYILCNLLLVLYCEYAIYYVVLLQCTWPSITDEHGAARVMLFADTHLLGWRNGHWLDKLRREWQMRRAFQTSMTIHAPDTIFLVGDALDEGKWAGPDEFQTHVQRFYDMFAINADSQKLHVLVGNHDVGFHYDVTKVKMNRFSEAFHATDGVALLRVRDVNFVLLNSMAFEGDDCELCVSAQQQLRDVARQIVCTERVNDPESECAHVQLDANAIAPFSRPVLLTHFPLFRRSESNCTGIYSLDPKETAKLRASPLRERWDCISKQSTTQLLKLLRPRVVFSGHTHYECIASHDLPRRPGVEETAEERKITEYTLSSFSWRNNKGPSFILAKFTPLEYSVSLCYIPHENTILWIYIVVAIFLFIWHFPPRRMFSILTAKRANKSS